MARVLRSLVACSLLTLGISGCELDVDLTATEQVQLGGTIDLKLKVTNESNCPVGLVTAIVIPNIPRNILIDQIPDAELREHVSDAFDEFCSSGDVDVPDGAEAFCQREGSDVVCTIDLGDGVDIPIGAQESLVVGEPSDNTEIVCTSNGDQVTCRIPQGVLEAAAEIGEQGGEQIPLICGSLGPIFICTALALNPGEMQMKEFQVPANFNGVVRHFALAFPEVDNGVCRGGALPGAPCEDDSGCPGFGMFVAPGVCKPGICMNSSTNSENNRGCDPAIAADCDSPGTCTTCNNGSGNLLSGVACDVTAVGAAAPAMSMWGYVATALALCVASMFMLLRARRREA